MERHEGPIAVVKGVFEWFKATPFEVLRGALSAGESYEEVGERLASAGHAIPFEIAPEMEIGDKVVVDALNVARGAGSGVVVERLVTQVWTLRDGRILRLAGYDSREEALAAIGAD